MPFCDMNCRHAAWPRLGALDGAGSCRTFQALFCEKKGRHVQKNAPCNEKQRREGHPSGTPGGPRDLPGPGVSLTGEEVDQAILARADEVTDPAGRKVPALRERDVLDLARLFGLSPGALHEKALTLGVYPLRYLRNRASITPEEQLRLCSASVAVIGAGGLGGQVLLLLARVGIGTLVVVDPDRFEETNLNRQMLSREETLGIPKVQAAEKELMGVNPGVSVIPHHVRLTRETGPGILGGMSVIVDALDSVEDRLLLQDLAQDQGIPLIHGAIAGFGGQVLTVFPGDPGLRLVYGTTPFSEAKETRPEALLGAPAPAPALVATLQCMEVLKVLLGRGKVFRNRLVMVDLETGLLEALSLGEEEGETP